MNLNLHSLESRFDLKAYVEAQEFKDVGQNWAITCPHCEKPEKLYILKEDKRDQRTGEKVPRGTFVCYYCADVEGTGTGRGILSLIEYLEDLSFYEAVKRLAEGGTQSDQSFAEAVGEMLAQLEDVDDDDADDSKPLAIPEVELPASFRPITAKNAPPYLRERGISIARAERYRLGFCRSGYYRKRLIVPTYLGGRLVSFQARYMREKPPQGIKKTIFPKGAKTGQVLFNYDQAKRCNRVVLVEDPFSAIRIGRIALCSFGTHLSRGQFELLLNSAAREVVVMWDRDAIDKAFALSERLAQFWKVRVVKLPDDRDPDEHKTKTLVKMINAARPMDMTDAFAANVKQRLRYL